eukprot:TRINITY_DN3431_c0_g1_i1.p1 TRINITY_DN3431_c0_g1~~TRINITY_DN3431_c0_g1_i1.p1  ORF type:complete len:367 (-),score=119.86 TRINITY_DN3431_c0_g1_i1:39-1139(-)
MQSDDEAWKESAATWRERYPNADLQAEFFLLKFGADIARSRVIELRDQFKRFDSRKRGELEEHEALRLLEARGEARTYTRLQEIVQSIGLEYKGGLGFLEWLCAVLETSWIKLHMPSIDPDVILKLEALAEEAEKIIQEMRAAKEEAIAQSEEVLKLTEEEERRRQQAEHEAQLQRAMSRDAARKKKAAERKLKEDEEKKRQELERLRQKTQRRGLLGVAGKFEVAMTLSKDSTEENMRRVKAEAEARRQAKLAEIARKEQEIREKEAAEARAKEDELRAEAEKKLLEAERLAEEERKAEEARRLAQEEKRKAKEREEEERRLKEIYEAEKRRAEREVKRKIEEEKRKREESKRRLMERATAFQKK